ncbi:CHY and RING finger domain protein [Blumeria hordei DH14]|uniref:CHY and RING finger domain protein n=1 Tax=Blumeria graminis f. sp. hordei (strain DH14) TaxID=546991 RepID=N1JHB0_BLUG1|nr:CHY and RING finger domain protein [Blumeria hordei DH14]
MSYLVHEFLIEPVLRQARQLSRSSTPRDSIPNLTAASLSSHEVAIDDTTAEHYRGSRLSDTSSLEAEESNNDAPSNAPLIFSSNLTTSQIEIDSDAENLELSDPPWPSGNVDSLQSMLRLSASEPPDRIPISNQTRTSSLSMTNTAAEPIFNDNLHDSRAAWPNPSNIASHRLTLDETTLNVSTLHPRTNSLPEDDGMKALRQKILLVQALNISPEQKARRMHHLLNRDYMKAKAKPQTKSAPPNTICQERPTTPGSLSFFLWQMNGSPESTAEKNSHIYQLSPEDLRQTYVPFEPIEYDDCGESSNKDEAQVLGCRHYQRNVKLQCSACQKWYTCRLCHDEVEDHILNRKATKNMLCMICGCAQRAGEFCAECGERTAWYYCDVCKLWDNDTRKSIYHCHDCGICRKGLGIGKDFFHCKQTCGTCMSTSVEHSHKCIERVSDCDCPICGEYMFTSPSPVVFMLCGHSIHKACYDEYLKSSYKCPICSKSTINMETQFRNLDRAVESQPMPPQFRDTKALVSCNDCYAKSVVIYHWLGLKCAICDSYNTAQLSILSGPSAATESIESNYDVPQDFGAREVSSSLHIPALIRPRRHSTFIQVAETNDRRLHRFSPLPRLQRVARSVSPIAGLRFYEEESSPNTVPTVDSTIEDELDFWGLDELPALISGENNQDGIDEEDSGEDSALEDCDDDGEEEDDDDFLLFGHR